VCARCHLAGDASGIDCSVASASLKGATSASLSRRVAAYRSATVGAADGRWRRASGKMSSLAIERASMTHMDDKGKPGTPYSFPAASGSAANLVAAGFLGLVERDVGAREERLGGIARAGQGKAYADG